MGLDPGLRHLGWGVIAVDGNHLTHIAHGVLSSDSGDDVAGRLCHLERQLNEVFVRHRPDHTAVESSFVNRNATTSLKLGQAQAVCLLVAARHSEVIRDYAPNLIKRAVVGAGHAQKQQIQAMVNMLLPQAGADNEHACDALAVAITHAHSYSALVVA